MPTGQEGLYFFGGGGGGWSRGFGGSSEGSDAVSQNQRGVSRGSSSKSSSVKHFPPPQFGARLCPNNETTAACRPQPWKQRYNTKKKKNNFSNIVRESEPIHSRSVRWFGRREGVHAPFLFFFFLFVLRTAIPRGRFGEKHLCYSDFSRCSVIFFRFVYFLPKHSCNIFATGVKGLRQLTLLCCWRLDSFIHNV